MYSPGQILYQKDFYFQIINQKVIEKISILTNKLYSEFYKQNKLLVTIYSLSFLFLVVDLTSLLLTLSAKGVFNKQGNNSSSWVLILPIIIEWFISLGFYINFQIRKKKLKKKVKQIIDDKRNRLKCYNKERASKLAKIFHHLSSNKFL